MIYEVEPWAAVIFILAAAAFPMVLLVVIAKELFRRK